MPTDDYYTFFLNSSADVVKLVTIELSHPNFSQTYYLTQNAIDGFTATLETAAVVVFQFCPMKISQNESLDNLDFGIQIELGDVGEILPIEFDNVLDADGFAIKPTLKYREYRRDDLTSPMIGPQTLQVDSFSFSVTGAKFEAKAPSLNISRTGEFYTIARFPMLRSFL